MDDRKLDERSVPLPRLGISRRRPHREIPAPQRPQIEIQPAVGIDEQGSAPFLLQHRQAVGGFQREILLKSIEVAGVRLRPPQCPATQAAQRQLLQQRVQTLQHRPETPRRLGRQLVDQCEVLAQQIGIAQSPGRSRQAVEQGRDHAAPDHRRQLHHRAEQVRNDVVPDFLGDQRGLLDVAEYQFGAASEFRQCAGALDVPA